ncbi:DUF6356 family protein [Sphingopyxis sp.]|uniref:DUF6356 family protein n=1 Tax=Sphingopyxis sp. TaxID=1908224 RepID=UPI001E05BF98|nr:DUF6356 family protein [Sphingopyxis sp.]MBW8294361.1 hypothetical protein [Sphingopyxis sp.]
MLRRLFTQHPADVDETYFEHFVAASGFAAAMAFGAAACLVHAVIPGLCVRTGSGVIARLHDRMIDNRRAR